MDVYSMAENNSFCGNARKNGPNDKIATLPQIASGCRSLYNQVETWYCREEWERVEDVFVTPRFKQLP